MQAPSALQSLALIPCEKITGEDFRHMHALKITGEVFAILGYTGLTHAVNNGIVLDVTCTSPSPFVHALIWDDHWMGSMRIAKRLVVTMHRIMYREAEQDRVLVGQGLQVV